MEKSTTDQWIDRGLIAHQAGQFAEAAACYDAALQLSPTDADALHLRGVAAHQLHENDLALSLVQRAIEQDTAAAEFHNNLGEIFRAKMDYAKAIAAYQQALLLDRNRTESLRNLGLAFQLAGRFSDALQTWDAVLAIAPDDSDSLNNRGLALKNLNRADEAIAAFEEALGQNPQLLAAAENLMATLNSLYRHEEAVQIGTMIAMERPENVQALINLGSVLIEAGRPKEAIGALYTALKKDPNKASAHFTMGLALQASRELVGAERAYRRAIELRPQLHAAYIQLSYLLTHKGEPQAAIVAAQQGLDLFPKSFVLLLNQSNALAQSHFMDEAAQAVEKAIELKPDSVIALNLLGTIYARLSKYEAAQVAYQRAIAADPTDLNVLGNYATMLALRGDLKSSVQAFRDSKAHGVQHADLHSNLLLYINGMPGLEPQEIFAEHVEWGRAHATGLVKDLNFSVTREPDRPLRVGYVSGDWRHHSVAYFITPLLEAHNRNHVVPVIYDNVPQPDSMTQFQRSLVNEWHRIVHLNDEELAQRSRDDRIDILVDLSGHTGGHRLRSFARRGAPIQVNYLGYPNTTGLPTMDYRLTDEIVDPPELSDAFHSEKLVRLEPPFICYRPSQDAPDVAALPALTRGAFTFCSFNAISKFNSAAIEMWSQVLKAVSGSRLLIKAAGMQELETQRRIIDEFARCDITTERLELLPRAPSHAAHMETYGICDLALDTFPYNGTTTTCEAFWMGVPVVTMRGPTHASRVSMTLLKSIGLDEFVADTPEQFVQIAVRFANDWPRLVELRRTMRDRMVSSTLMNAPRKAASIESAYRTMWHTWLSAVEKADKRL